MRKRLDSLSVKKANLEAYNRVGYHGIMKERYWTLAVDYNYRLFYNFIDQQLGLNHKKVCELGCGIGDHLKWYIKKCEMIVGIDIARGVMLNLALTGGGTSSKMDLAAADALTLPFKAGSFDIVTIYQSAHHFPSIYECMNEMLRVAGAFAFLEPNRDSLIHVLLEWRREKVMRSPRFEIHDYHNVEYNSRGFTIKEIKNFLRLRGVKVRTGYIFNLPLEISARIVRRSEILFRILTLFGHALTNIPVVRSQFGGLLVIAQTRRS